MRTALPVVALLATVTLAPMAAHGYSKMGPKWLQEQVTYCLTPNLADVNDATPEQARAAVERAIATWNNAACSYFLAVPDTEPCVTVADSSDRQNNIFWASRTSQWHHDEWPFGASTIGITLGSWNPQGNYFVDSDIGFNDINYNWNIDAETDVETIALHEFGHFLGLGHEENNTDAVMYPYHSQGELKQSLHDDDLQGICAIYPEGTGPNNNNAGTVAEYGRCNSPIDCQEGLDCLSGAEDSRCFRLCDSSQECGTDQVCYDAGVKVCLEKVDEGDDCGRWSVCTVGVCLGNTASMQCYRECNSRADCADDQICDSVATTSGSVYVCVDDPTPHNTNNNNNTATNNNTSNNNGNGGDQPWSCDPSARCACDHEWGCDPNCECDPECYDVCCCDRSDSCDETDSDFDCPCDPDCEGWGSCGCTTVTTDRFSPAQALEILLGLMIAGGALICLRRSDRPL